MNADNSTLIEILAEYIVQLRREPVQPEVRKKARQFFTDAVCVMLAGCKETATKLVADYARSIGGKPTAYLWGTCGERTDTYHAAMVNGVAAHVHDYDDVCTTMIGHPSVAVLPCVLALGEELNISGEEALRAYIVGMEICALMGRAFSPEHNRRGWHSTSSLGVFGATAAAATLLKLERESIICALGIAASESCGLKGNSGTMTKPLHAGRAAAKGIMAAKLAMRGFTSNKNIMEMESGFIRVTTGVCHMDAVLQAINTRNSEFLHVGFLMKPWPACRATHNGVWAMLELLRKYDITAEKIERVDCRMLPYAADILRYSVVSTPTEGKFSINYVIAKIILNRALVMDDFEGEYVTDQAVIDMMQKIHMIIDEKILPGVYYDYHETTIVDVFLKDGRKLSERCDYAKGTAENPLTEDEMHTKWKDCLKRSIRKEEQDSFICAVEKVDELLSLRKLADMAIECSQKEC